MGEGQVCSKPEAVRILSTIAHRGTRERSTGHFADVADAMLGEFYEPARRTNTTALLANGWGLASV
jgi:hypothetical protein